MSNPELDNYVKNPDEKLIEELLEACKEVIEYDTGIGHAILDSTWTKLTEAIIKAEEMGY